MLNELLKLSRNTREALREAIAVAEVFETHVESKQVPNDPESLQIFSNFAYIFFTPKDIQVRGKHDRLLYFTGYIGSMNDHIQVDPGSALGIMPEGWSKALESYHTSSMPPKPPFLRSTPVEPTLWGNQAQVPNQRVKDRNNMLHHWHRNFVQLAIRAPLDPP